MAFVGFGGFNQANQALILQQQVRKQLGIPAEGLGLTSPNTPSGGASGALAAQVSDQQKAQQIMREIALEQQAVRTGRIQGAQAPQQSPIQGPQRPANMMQMGFMLNMLMMTMMAFAQMGNGFSTFMGGPPQYPQYAAR